MNKMMIINWRWAEIERNSIPLKYDIYENVLFISNYDGQNIKQLQKFINTKVDALKPVKVLVLLHYNTSTDVEGSIFANAIPDKSTQNWHSKTKNISGDCSYQSFIYDCSRGMIDDSSRELIKIENYEKVWKYYLDTIEFVNHKKSLINLWLQLAIDIKGLSEVKDEIRTEYFEEIKRETVYLESLKSFPNTDEFPRWEEIIKELVKDETKKDYGSFNPLTLVKEIEKNVTLSSFKESEAKYLEKEIDNKPNPKFLPNWLQEVVKKIDEKIKT